MQQPVQQRNHRLRPGIAVGAPVLQLLTQLPGLQTRQFAITGDGGHGDGGEGLRRIGQGW